MSGIVAAAYIIFQAYAVFLVRKDNQLCRNRKLPPQDR